VFHRGNRVFGGPRNPSTTERSSVTNLTDLIDAKPYAAGHSDMVALTLLVHQAHLHNLIGETAYLVRDSNDAGKVAEASEPLVRALLFSGAPPLEAPIQGSSEFVKEFSRLGIRDGQGRSLRDFDLNHRLFRYPLSYLVYSEQFNQLPDLSRNYIYRRLWEVLTGKDQSAPFAHLTDADRKAVLEIMQDTKPDFRAWLTTLN
jgi:hypothetical protein